MVTPLPGSPLPDTVNKDDAAANKQTDHQDVNTNNTEDADGNTDPNSVDGETKLDSLQFGEEQSHRQVECHAEAGHDGNADVEKSAGDGIQHGSELETKSEPVSDSDEETKDVGDGDKQNTSKPTSDDDDDTDTNGDGVHGDHMLLGQSDKPELGDVLKENGKETSEAADNDDKVSFK